MSPDLGESAGVRPASRLAWVDVARGIGILLVVYCHALRAQVTSNQFDPAWNATLQDGMIYAFHMHLFFFLAGLFVAGSVAKGSGIFWRTKLVSIVYPYLLWTLISVTLAVLASGATNYEMGFGELSNIWYKPIYQYWFLYALLVCDLVAWVIRANRAAALVLILLGAAGLLTFVPGIFGVSAPYFPFFFGGLVLAPYILALRVNVMIAMAIVLTGAAIFALSFWQAEVFATVVGELGLALVRGASGVMVTIALSMAIGYRAPWLALLGTATMAIYVMHTIFSAGLRIALTATGLGTPNISLIACALVGIVAPLVIWAVARRFGLLTWLGLGTDVSKNKVLLA